MPADKGVCRQIVVTKKRQMGETFMKIRTLGSTEALLVILLFVAAPFSALAKNIPASAVDGQTIENANAHPGEWMAPGRTYSEQRFSPLKQINTKNVKSLGVAWQFRTHSVRGLEGTPLVVGGKMYITLPWSRVIALNAVTGKELWSYDPKVPGQTGRYACCDVVNRGVAMWKGALFLGTLDGRLVKLNAKTGKPMWIVNTIDSHNPVYTITGAPRVVDGLVVIGNGGAEYNARGYLTAYDANTGKKVWRFYVVPGNPHKPQANPALKAALKTWDDSGKFKWWKMGGGGGPWNAMSFDPKLGLLYVGTGNGDPWNRQIRSPKGGDNLYLSSILAIHVKTGRLAWYYQTTPGDTWDFDSTADVTLANIKIDGKLRHVLMHAPKNGFFYVLDRKTGKLISAKKFGLVTWASHIDMKTGRPVVNPGARYVKKMATVEPGPTGAHNWQPMTYDPDTGLVYIPAMDGGNIFKAQKNFHFRPGAWNTGVDFAALSKVVLKMVESGEKLPPSYGYIKAWNPATQKEVWQVRMGGAWNSGLLSTAGGLVFGGDAYGRFNAYNARTGHKLWSINLKTGILAPPMSYEINGTQYVALLAGYGGAGGLATFRNPKFPMEKYHNNQGRLFVFKLGGYKHVKALKAEGVPFTEPPPETASKATIAKGFDLYADNCMVCHGYFAQSAGEVPDLRLMPSGLWKQFDNIVLGGMLHGGGMGSFKDILSKDDVHDIKAYVLQQSHLAWDSRHKEK